MSMPMHEQGRKRKARQLMLTEQVQQIPRWGSLPEESRRLVVELLAMLLQSGAIENDAVQSEEADDE